MMPEISILILTHNQRPLLERCLDSVLNQQIKVPYEIIISDDGAQDGTEEFVKSLCVSERVTGIKTLLGLRYFHFNPDDCDLSRGTRIGWNRLNAYLHAKGKYFVNADADDFLIGTTLYQSEYEALEAHPECSMVLTRTLELDNGSTIDSLRKSFPHSDKLKDGAVFSLEDVLWYGLRGLHSSYMYRRRPQDNIARAVGGFFDDVFITYYHLQFGPVVFLDTTGYVWVQYPCSDSHSLSKDDRLIAYGLIPVRLARLFKPSRYIFLGKCTRTIEETIATAPKYPDLSSQIRERFSVSDIFIFRFYAQKHHGLFSWSRYWLVFVLLKVMMRYHLSTNLWLRFLYLGLV